MREQIKVYVDGLFKDAALTIRNAEVQQEILQHTLDRYDDLIAAGKSEQEAYDEAVGGIGLGRAGKGEPLYDHVLYLLFRCFAFTHDGLFDLQGGVFGYGQAMHDQCCQCRAARLSEHECGGRIDVDEYLLHGGLLRLVSSDDFIDMAYDDGDAFRQRCVRRSFDAAGCDVEMLSAADVDDAEAGYAAAGVYAQDAGGL